MEQYQCNSCRGLKSACREEFNNFFCSLLPPGEQAKVASCNVGDDSERGTSHPTCPRHPTHTICRHANKAIPTCLTQPTKRTMRNNKCFYL